jgi:alanyl-tRNA synthetase
MAQRSAKAIMTAYENFDDSKKFACRVIADHARATAFSIADGILPGNEGRNYVLRKIMRRAIYHGREHLGFTAPFFYRVTNFVVDEMHEAYPELEVQRGFIERIVKLEEERFGTTLTVGLKKLEETYSDYYMETIDRAFDLLKERGHITEDWGPTPSLAAIASDREYWKAEFRKTNNPVDPPIEYPSLQDRFNRYWARQVEDPENIVSLISSMAKLYDTYGTPRDLIRLSFEERNFALDETEFTERFDSALSRLQQVHDRSKGETKSKTRPVYVALGRRRDTRSDFQGYETTSLNSAKALALVKSDVEVNALVAGDDGEIILDRTPFYAESGGQVGDTGQLRALATGDSTNPPATAGGTDFMATVVDTFSPVSGLIVHKIKVEQGSIKVGDTVSAEVDVEKRDATRRNHTATHLMHAALREVLGTHVKQAGSVVAPNYLRFDFMHYQPLTKEEVTEIERLVNYHILRNEPVRTDVMAIEEAMRTGAMALFGEKYGEQVRVLSIRGAEDIFSKELCGGTHVRATGDIGSFKITSDESIASGVRRIRAVTGADAFTRFQESETLIDELAGGLHTSRAELPALVAKLQDELKKARREADDLKIKIATGAAGSGSSNGDDVRDIAGVKVLARDAGELDANAMRQMSDTLLSRLKSGVVVIGRAGEGKVSLIVRTSDDLTKRVPAGQVIKELAPIVGGKGGGRPDMAEGGGNLPDKLADALAASYEVIEKLATK